MSTYQITDPKGVLLDGELRAEGEKIRLDKHSGQIRCWLHFNQVVEVEDEPELSDEPSPEKGPDHKPDKKK